MATTYTDITNRIDCVSKEEIKKFKDNYKTHKNFDKYIFQASKKIFKKLINPYFRFEVLLRCIKDINNNDKYYQNIKNSQKYNLIYKRLQNICLHLNIVLEEFVNLLPLVKKQK